MNKNNDEIIYFFEEVYEYTVNNFKKNSKFKPNDLYFKIRQLQIDARGSFGQKFIMYGLKKNGFKARDDDDKNKDWDIEFENYRIEIKTATLDVNDKFQHEGALKKLIIMIYCYF